MCEEDGKRSIVKKAPVISMYFDDANRNTY